MYEHALLRGEGTRFEENAIGKRELPNVMQVCAHGNRFVMRFGKAHGFGDFQRKAADATGMAFGCGVAKVNCGAEGFESVFIAAFHQLKSGFDLLGAFGDHLFEMQSIAFNFLFQAFLLQGAVEAGNHQFFLKRLH